MKRLLVIGLVAMLFAACFGWAALAQSQDRDALSVEVTLDEQAPSDTAAVSGDGIALDLDAGALADPRPGLSDESNAAQSGGADANKIVTTKYIVYEIEDGEAAVVSADKVIRKADILDYVKGYPVTRVADEAFSGCKYLWSVTVPDTVTEIGEKAFYNCKALVDVDLPDSVVEIGPFAFRNCITISHLVLPAGLTQINQGVFENCQMMWKLSIPSGVTRIGEGAFYKCLSLKQFTMPKSLTEIGDSAFELCESMTHVTIPAGVEVIPNNAFKDCVDLRKLALKEGLTSIGENAFFKCDSMRELKLPSTVENIGRYAFAYCEDVKTLTIPGKVESVGYGAFFHCAQLEEIIIKSGVNRLGFYCFAQCRALKKAAIPESVETIGDDAFTVGYASRIDDYGDVEQDTPLTQPKNLKIYGRPDSAASEYAEEYGVPFVIQKIPATSVSIAEGESATLYMGNTMQLTAVQKPANAEMTLKWKSDSSSVKVSKNGLLTPKHSGKATITVTTENGKRAKIVIKVVDAKSVSIQEGKSITMKVGETLQLNAVVSPSQVKTKLTWKSDKKRVASVSSTGMVMAKKKGTAEITVKTANGKKARIKIKVVE